MSKREAVLQLLRQAEGTAMSGQEIATQLGVSRAAVWKIIRQLQEEGYQILAGKNRGYLLQAEPDRLDASEIGQMLPEIPVVVLQSVDSTNTEAKRRLVAGLSTPLLLTAESQSAGRGRQGKSFYSPPGTGVYLTLVVHPNAPLRDAVSITTRASVAVCRAIRAVCSAKPEIKWVNDLYLNGKKICGILVEAISDFETGVTKSLVIGVGINVRTVQFPKEIPNAASLNELGCSRNRLIAEVAKQLLRETADLESRAYLSDYRAWSLVLGKQILYSENGCQQEGVALEIDENGGLLVQHPDGSRKALHSGEISLRLAQHESAP